jgi:DMSO reductase family type II enzyme chaperone|tara:strand:+ start:31760 stop:32392 length:633 start_codon:yes stop_codon:yes gene_type:complete
MHNPSHTLFARSAAYSLFSHLTSSPHEDHVIFSDVAAVAEEIGRHLPFEIDFSPIMQESKKATASNWQEIVQSYSGLFEVGNNGPPIPIREGANASLVFKKEEVARYYEYFGYEVSEDRKWESDHLSIELEFIHYLCEGEKGREDALSFQLAQRDFINRHLILWLASINYKMKQLEAHPYWKTIFSTLYVFVQQDLQWVKEKTKELKEAV